MRMIRNLILTLGLLSGTANAQSTIGYFGAGHLITETSLKTTQMVMNDWEVVKYNRLFSSTLSLLIAVQYESQTDHSDLDKVKNIGAYSIGILTGNIFQVQW